MHLSRALVLYNITTAMLKKKYNTFITFISIVGLSMLYSFLSLKAGNYSQKAEYTILALYFVLEFIIISIVMHGKLFVKLVTVVFSFLTMMASSIIYFSTVNYVFGYDFTNAYATTIDIFTLLATSLFMVVLSFLVVLIIKLVQKKLSKGLNYNIKYIYLYIFPLTHFFGFQLVNIVQQLFVKKLNYFPKRITYFFCIYVLICFLIDFTIIFVADYMEKKEEENLKYKNLLAKNELDYQQFLQLKNEKEKFRKIRHDIANILTTAGGFIEIDKPEKALEIIQNAGNDIELSANREICKNETINTIYTIKHNEAQDKGINLSIEVKEGADIKISDYDLCRILTNLIDNQINAVMDNKDDKNTSLSIIANSSEVMIKGVNAYSKPSKKKQDDPNHGYGQKIVSDIAKKYDGTYQGNVDGDVFITKTVLKNRYYI